MNKTKNEKSEKKSQSAVGKLATKMILRIVTIVCILAVLFFAAKFSLAKFTQLQIEKKRVMVERELKESAELVLYKMRYSDIISIKKKYALSSAYTLVRYAGIVRVGIEDISQCEISISSDGKNLSVKIPNSILLGNEISKQEVFDSKQGIFAKITTQEIFDEIENAKQEAVHEILQEGLLEEADTRAALVIKQLLAPIGFENIVVELK